MESKLGVDNLSHTSGALEGEEFEGSKRKKVTFNGMEYEDRPRKKNKPRRREKSWLLN